MSECEKRRLKKASRSAKREALLKHIEELKKELDVQWGISAATSLHQAVSDLGAFGHTSAATCIGSTRRRSPKRGLSTRGWSGRRSMHTKHNVTRSTRGSIAPWSGRTTSRRRRRRM